MNRPTLQLITPFEKTCSETNRFALLYDLVPAQFVITPHSLTYFLRLPNVFGTAEQNSNAKRFKTGNMRFLLLYCYFSKVQKLSHGGSSSSNGTTHFVRFCSLQWCFHSDSYQRTIGYCFSTYASNIEDCLCQTKDSLCAYFNLQMR